MTEPPNARQTMPPINQETADQEKADEQTAVANALEPEPFDLAALVDNHQAEIWRYLRYLGAKPTEADDLTQDVFLEVARKPFQQNSPKQSAAYLRTVAKNQLLMLRRKHKREGQQVDIELVESAWSEIVWANQVADGKWNQYAAALTDCTEQLEGKSRQVIDLHYRDKTPREKIAESFDMKPDGVKTLLRRVRQKLRECVERKLASA